MAAEDRAAERGGTSGSDLGWIRARARAALVLERLWPLLFGLGCVAALFLTLAWFGLFAALPFVGRSVVVGLLAILALVVAWRARGGYRWPRRSEVDARIEAASRLAHQPLRTQTDRMAGGDAFGAALWREHQRRMAEKLANLTGGAPETRTERLDPLALRAVLAMLLVTAFAFSFGSKGGRVADAFVSADAPLIAGARVDAWVTPPGYTGRPPLFLTGGAQPGAPVSRTADAAPAGAPATTDPARPIAAPEGSILSVRISDGSGATLTFTPADGTPPIAVQPVDPAAEATGEQAAGSPEATPETSAEPRPESASRDYELPLKASGTVRLATTFRALGEWRFDVLPDVDPAIDFKDPPSEARNGALQLTYRVTDDYGVGRGGVEMRVLEDTAPGARPLLPPPEIKLALPRRTKGTAEGRTSADVTKSPYAGAKVALTLLAVDDAGQEGRSPPREIVLPQRRFTDPLARAVIEQRRILALDANAAPRVVDMLDAVTLRGEEFIRRPADFLALKAARTRIASAANDEALVSAVDFLWQIALGIEDGDLSLAEQRLRDAQENLAEALENNASDEEIDRLMAELREAMQEYMQAMAEAMRNQPPMNRDEMQAGDMQEVRPQDLERMMDRIEDLAKSGSKDAARQLLSELQQMMDNMQAMRPGQNQQGGEQSAMQQQLDKMGEILRQQQRLMDQTFDLGRQRMQQDQQNPGQQNQQGQQGEPQAGQQNSPGEQGENGEPQAGQQDGQGQRPMTAEELEQALKRLQGEQGKLQEELQAMQEALEGMGMQSPEGFGEAGEAMGEAEGALGKGRDGEAVGEQGRALEALRRGAQEAMQQMQQAMQGQQPGQPGQQGQPGQGQMGQGLNGQQQQSGRDPLGRERQTQGPDFGQDVGVPDEIDTQRARRILDEIRKRLGNSLSPELERQYLERLLQTP